MKFSQLNEAVNAERFAKNVRERSSYGPLRDFELQNFAEQEGSTKALEDIYKWVGYALEGREPIVDALFTLFNLKYSAEKDAEYTKQEFRRDSRTGYAKTIGAFLSGIEKNDLLKITTFK